MGFKAHARIVDAKYRVQFARRDISRPADVAVKRFAYEKLRIQGRTSQAILTTCRDLGRWRACKYSARATGIAEARHLSGNRSAIRR